MGASRTMVRIATGEGPAEYGRLPRIGRGCGRARQISGRRQQPAAMLSWAFSGFDRAVRRPTVWAPHWARKRAVTMPRMDFTDLVRRMGIRNGIGDSSFLLDNIGLRDKIFLICRMRRRPTKPTAAKTLVGAPPWMRDGNPCYSLLRRHEFAVPGRQGTQRSRLEL
jgi:hypothetical protein